MCGRRKDNQNDADDEHRDHTDYDFLGPADAYVRNLLSHVFGWLFAMYILYFDVLARNNMVVGAFRIDRLTL